MNVTFIDLFSIRELEAEAVEISTTEGQYTILPGHSPLIATLLPNSPFIVYIPGGVQKSFTIETGIVRIDRSSILVLLG